MRLLPLFWFFSILLLGSRARAKAEMSFYAKRHVLAVLVMQFFLCSTASQLLWLAMHYSEASTHILKMLPPSPQWLTVGEFFATAIVDSAMLFITFGLAGRLERARRGFVLMFPVYFLTNSFGFFIHFFNGVHQELGYVPFGAIAIGVSIWAAQSVVLWWIRGFYKYYMTQEFFGALPTAMDATIPAKEIRRSGQR